MKSPSRRTAKAAPAATEADPRAAATAKRSAKAASTSAVPKPSAKPAAEPAAKPASAAKPAPKRQVKKVAAETAEQAVAADIAPPHQSAAADLPPSLQKAKPLHFRHLAPPFDGYLGVLPEVAGAVPSMMSTGEREFLYGLARDYYTGAGVIVDAGTFLGASTMCLGMGLEANPHLPGITERWGRPIVSFELGVTNANMPLSFKRHQVGQTLRAGDSFAPIVREHIAPVADLVDMRFGNILELGEIEDETKVKKTPVELLFLDLLKSFDLSEYCYKQYFPRLIPRRSIVIQQDYINGDLPFIHIHQEFFADKFEYIGELSSSAIFRLVHRITPAEVDDLFANPPDGETQIRLVSQATQRTIDNHRRVIIAFSKLRIILRAHGVEAARRYWDYIESDYAPQIAQDRFRRVQNVVRAGRYLCEVGPGEKHEQEAVAISTGHRGMDHRRTDLIKD